MTVKEDGQILKGTVETIAWPLLVTDDAGEVIARIDHRGLIYSSKPGSVSSISADCEEDAKVERE